MNIDEMKAQFAWSKEASEIEFAEAAPAAQASVKQYTLPLKPNQYFQIHRRLGRKQITLEDIPADVLKEFKKTRNYAVYQRKFNDPFSPH